MKARRCAVWLMLAALGACANPPPRVPSRSVFVVCLFVCRVTVRMPDDVERIERERAPSETP